MRMTFWLVALFAVAVGAALLVGGNASTVTLFWAPYRIDVSLNLALLVLLTVFLVGHLAWRALSALFHLPHHARRWRLQQKERAMHAALLDSLTQMLTGRYLRAIRSAEQALELEALLREVRTSDDAPIHHAPQLQALAHLVAAESAQALRDRETRVRHLQAAQEVGHAHRSEAVTEVMDAAYLQAARWALSDRDAPEALRWLDGLRQGTARRTLTLRMRLKAARIGQQPIQALETARQLVKHGAFTDTAAQALVRELAIASLNEARDVAQLHRGWQALSADDRALVEVALHAAQRLAHLGGDAQDVMLWLTPVWNRMVQEPESCHPAVRERVVVLLAHTLSQLPVDAQWLASVERARAAYPRWSELVFLAGMVCWHHGLWGKAQQLLELATSQLKSPELLRQSWCTLAQLAEQKEDADRAQACWRRAAEIARPL